MTKPRPKATTDRHKPSRMLRVPARLADCLERLSDQHVTSFTAEGVRAIREYLERNGLWPPPPKDGARSPRP